MAVLPISRAVSVNITAQTEFPDIRGFGTPMIVTDETTGPLDATTRVRTYSSIEEVGNDWGAADEAYKAAQTVFGQKPRPAQVKIGWRDDEASVTDELDAIRDYDRGFFQVVFTKSIRGVAADEDAAADWTSSNGFALALGTTDVLIFDKTDTTNVAYRNRGKAGVSVTFNADADEYAEAAVAAYTATRNLDAPNQSYTTKFKRLRNVTPISRPSGDIAALTGFSPSTGRSYETGHMANGVVNIGGAIVYVEGSTVDGGFIDEYHEDAWIKARIEEEVLGLFTSVAKVPMTDTGANLIVEAVARVLERALEAGIIAADTDENGDPLPPYSVTAARVLSLSAAQRRERIAPPVSFTYRRAGAAHFAVVNGTITV